MRKLDYVKQIGETQAEHVGGGNAGKHATSSMQSVMLQKYPTLPFPVIPRIGFVFRINLQ